MARLPADIAQSTTPHHRCDLFMLPSSNRIYPIFYMIIGWVISLSETAGKGRVDAIIPDVKRPIRASWSPAYRPLWYRYRRSDRGQGKLTVTRRQKDIKRRRC
jgi:hypothetical protein